MTAVLRLPQATTCLAVVRGPLLPERIERLRAAYAPVLGESCSSGFVTIANGSVSVVVMGAGLGLTHGQDTIAWGCPVGASGDASEAEIAAALDDPAAHAASLAGVFVLVRWRADGVRVVTSASMPHTLRNVGGEGITVWATRAVAAHVLAGKRPRIDPNVVAEQVMFDYVVGVDELVAGTRICEEATVIDADDRGGATEASWWPRSARLAPSDPPTTPTGIREAVGVVASRFAGVTGAHQALTAGRDSRLVFEALLKKGVRMPALTMGWPGLPDVVGAQGLARAAGVPHRVATPRPQSAEGPLECLARFAVWSEGMEVPSNYLGGWPDVGAGPVTLVTGHGGEIGRSFHWKAADRQALAHPARVLFSDKWTLAPPGVVAATLARVEQELCGLEQHGLSPTHLLDRFYATNRMHSWIGRLLPDPSLSAYLPVYLEPGVAQTLLGLPEDVRRSGTAFDPLRPMGWGRRTSQRIVRRARREADRRAGGRSPRHSEEVLLLQRISSDIRQGSLSRDVLGDSWMRTALASCATDVKWRRALWNAVGVDVAATRLRELFP